MIGVDIEIAHLTELANDLRNVKLMLNQEDFISIPCDILTTFSTMMSFMLKDDSESEAKSCKMLESKTLEIHSKFQWCI
jgi:hypothetical protein